MKHTRKRFPSTALHLSPGSLRPNPRNLLRNLHSTFLIDVFKPHLLPSLLQLDNRCCQVPLHPTTLRQSIITTSPPSTLTINNSQPPPCNPESQVHSLLSLSLLPNSNKLTASQALLDTFRDFTTNTSLRGFLVTIEKESLIPGASFPASSSFDDDLHGLESLLTTDVATYIILRREPAPAPLVSIAYVPDAANVRQKMLIASTRNTLIRELGSEKFGESIFTTEKHELTAEGFRKHDAHTKE